jgi:hypothetical protein
MSLKISQLPPAGAANLDDAYEASTHGGAPSVKVTLAQIVATLQAQALTFTPTETFAGGKIALNANGSSSFSNGVITFGAAGNASFSGGAVSFSLPFGSASFAFGLVNINVDGSFATPAFTVSALGTVSAAGGNIQLVSDGSATLASGLFQINTNGSFLSPGFSVDNTGQISAVGGSVSFLAGGEAVFAGQVTIGGGAPIKKALTATAVLDFPSTAAGAASDLTIALPGAALGDCVILGLPNSSTVASGVFSAWVSAADTVKVRFDNTQTVGNLDPASGTFRVAILQF